MSSPLSANQLFAIARSEFIDAHNEADSAIRDLLVALKQPSRQLISQNIELLASQPAAPHYSKSEKARIDGLLSEMKAFNSLRCDLVHSRMEVMAIRGASYACFMNVQEQCRYGSKGLILTLEELNRAKRDLVRIVTNLKIKPEKGVVKQIAA